MHKVEAPEQHNAAAAFSSIHASLLQVLTDESDALRTILHSLPQTADTLVQEIFSMTGRLIICGIGKSGHVARKLVATFSSLGTPAIFLHAGEALHGDAGMILPSDLIIFLSKSGTGSEVEALLPVLDAQGNKTALICCQDGVLASKVGLVVKLPLAREACALNLAPTSSSTIMMAFGDAVAVVVSQLKQFTTDDFARVHPAGALGRKYFLCVSQIMHKQSELPLLCGDAPFKEVILLISRKKYGVGIVVDDQMHLQGIVTDGDLRRACEREDQAVFTQKAQDIMTKQPKSISPQARASEALELMQKYSITSLVVVEEQVVVGLIHMHDLIKLGF